MFTSRAEYRLLLREDNAEFRLRERGFEAGLVEEAVYNDFIEKKRLVEEVGFVLDSTRLTPSPQVNGALSALGHAELKKVATLRELLRRQSMTLKAAYSVAGLHFSVEPSVAEIVEIETKYEGYIKRQTEETGRFHRIEGLKLPTGLSYNEVSGLSSEIREKLTRLRPDSIGQASRISGVTPASISMLMVHLKKIGAYR